MSGADGLLEGVDVSHWQVTTPSLHGLSFLFARATYGTREDGGYAHHVANARAAGLVTGAYHFGRGVESPADQAAAFLATARAADLLALDLEADGDHAPMSADQARVFIAAIHRAGRTIGLYHSESGYPAVGQDWAWVANWGREPAIPWTFWQYQGAPLDHDAFRGSESDLRALAGTGGEMKTITDEDPAEIEVAAGATLYEIDGVTPIRKVTAEMPWRPSPFRCGSQRAIYYGSTETRRLALVAPHAIRYPAPPVPDCSAAWNEALVAAEAAVAAIPRR